MKHDVNELDQIILEVVSDDFESFESVVSKLSRRCIGFQPRILMDQIKSRLLCNTVNGLVGGYLMCSSSQFQQPVKEARIALQGKAQILRGHVVAKVPLLFQARTLVRKAFSESLHYCCHQFVGVFDRSAWLIYETGQDLGPLRSELSPSPIQKTRE